MVWAKEGMAIMAGRMLMSILPAKDIIEEWRRLRAGRFLSGLRSFSNLFLLCFFLLSLVQLA
jgi:hypothetical protein